MAPYAASSLLYGSCRWPWDTPSAERSMVGVIGLGTGVIADSVARFSAAEQFQRVVRIKWFVLKRDGGAEAEVRCMTHKQLDGDEIFERPTG